jgi:hypothetical protein
VGRLRCDVSVLSFSDLFVHLFNSGKSGVLTVFQGTMKKSFYVNADGVSLLATTGQARSMGEMLIRTRKVSRAQLDQLLDEKAMSGRRLAELVQRRGLLTAEDVHIAKRDHVEEELHELFTWKNAVCEFVETSPPRMIENFYAGVVVGKAATALMLESARRSDELARIMTDLGDEQLVPISQKTWNGELLEGVSTDLLYSVYRGINGSSNLAEVVRRSLYPRLEALRAVHAFVLHKIVTLVDPNKATETLLSERTEPVPGISEIDAPATPAGFGIKEQARTIVLLGEMMLYKAPLAMLLRGAGYVVRTPTFDTLPRGLEKSDRVSVAMVDVGVRNLSAYPVSELPWESSGRRIVAIGRDASLGAKRKAFEQGANVYAVMPFTRKNILGILNAVLAPANDLHLPFYTSDIS